MRISNANAHLATLRKEYEIVQCENDIDVEYVVPDENAESGGGLNVNIEFCSGESLSESEGSESDE